MASSSADVAAANRNTSDRVLRARPHRGPGHGNGAGVKPASGLRNSPDTASEPTSGATTPLPDDALPSDQSLFDARKHARAEHRRLSKPTIIPPPAPTSSSLSTSTTATAARTTTTTTTANGRRLFPTVDYTSRVSHFDPESDYTDFHGFYTLFWIGLCILAITTMLRNIKDTGYPMRVQIWALFTVKLQHLAIADFLMVLTTAVSLPLQRLVRAAPAGSAWTWKKGGAALQSLYQAAWLTGWVAVPFLFHWTWTAQVFFLLHTMTMLMKMHSYAFYNGHLSETEKRLRALDDPSTASRAPAYLYPTAENPEGTLSSPKRTEFKIPPANEDHGAHSPPPSPAASEASDEEVENLRHDLARELTSPLGNVTYPRNLTWANFVDYLLCPTLCYELEYPRTPRINWAALSSKFVATFVCIFLLTIVSEEFILPVLTDASVRLNPAPSSGLPRPSVTETLLVLSETISWLLFPFMITFLLVFLVIFEYVLGAFAEITRFADRHFYSDWWNSTDWMQFSRRWNVPVYSFLRRHVYSASRARLGTKLATLTTFLISAVGHEVVMACITKKLRGYGFVCQMLQLPIVALQRTRWARGRRTLNNAMFWCSMIMGLSLICSLYVLI